MRILVTGAKGFIGTNLIAGLQNNKVGDILEFDTDSNDSLLEQYCREADFVYHLAGVNRPKEEKEYTESNVNLTSKLTKALIKYNNTCPLVYASSIQAMLDNPYGKSKKAAEDLLCNYRKETGARVIIYRFPNIFGKWCRPNYNSVIATFCYNAAHALPITVKNPDTELQLVYIDDLVDELLSALSGGEHRNKEFCEIPIVYHSTPERLAQLIRSFQTSRTELAIPDLSDSFIKKLYGTYLTYLPEEELSYELRMKPDQRGSFTEFIKQPEIGQISINISRPGILKGNHWHNTKHEKFLVVSGRAVIRLRKLTSPEVIQFPVDSEKLQVVEIPPGYIHHIENTGDSDLVTVIWANECFDPQKPDTYYMEV